MVFGRRRRTKPGDGHPLQPYRWWQLFSRALFHLRIRTTDGTPQTWSVDVRLWGDADGVVVAQLYQDGVNRARSKLPAALPVPGGEIEVVASSYGLKRCHYVADDGSVRQLTPDPRSAEGRRAGLDRRHPALSRGISVASVGVLVIGVALGAPQIAEQITAIPVVADNLGTFVSPVHLPAWANIGLLVATIVASTERALRLRYNWLLDGGLFDGDS